MNAMVQRETILAHLRRVIDPELGVNIVDLGLVYGVRVKRQRLATSRKKSLRRQPTSPELQGSGGFGGKAKVNVFIEMTLTTPGCPLAGIFDRLVGDAVREIEGVADVSITLTFDPPWTPSLMSDEAKAQLGFD